MSSRKRRIAELDAKALQYYRCNPCIACEELLGIRLIDSQKYILQESWNKSHVLWCCSRNFGKSFLGAIFMLLKAILFENQAIYIVSSVGDQSKQTFTVMEQLILRIGKASKSIKTLKDIAEKETVKTPTNKTGFSHAQTGFHVEFYNGSEIFTLNGNPDNNRSKRSTLVFFDEAAFSSDELIAVCEAFATQESDFTTSTDENFDPETETRKCPTQLVYASSMSEMDKMFYKHYKNFAKKMFAGDRDYFVCDMICDTAIHTYMNGKKYKPLLSQDKVDAAMAADRDKALREYYNKPIQDGGENQIIKWGTIRRNEAFVLPILYNSDGSKYVLAFDPARTKDNSVLTIMRIRKDPEIGYYGEIVNCINMLDFASKKRFKLDSTRQLNIIKETLLNYNGKSPDYENISEFSVDAGAGGGGVSTYSDGLLNEWEDHKGKKHKGLLDSTYEIYEGYDQMYPDNSNVIKLINPRKYKKEMTEEAIELLNLDLIKFPMSYQMNGTVTLNRINKDTQEEELYEQELSWEEECALMSIDELKRELTSIFRFKNKENTTVTYALPKDKENTMHDDRFYTFIMLSHYLYGLRRNEFSVSDNSDYDFDFSDD